MGCRKVNQADMFAKARLPSPSRGLPSRCEEHFSEALGFVQEDRPGGAQPGLLCSPFLLCAGYLEAEGVKIGSISRLPRCLKSPSLTVSLFLRLDRQLLDKPICRHPFPTGSRTWAPLAQGARPSVCTEASGLS